MSLLPEISASGHLWCDEDHGPWIDLCAEREPTLRRELLDSLEATDCRPWFSGAPQPSTVQLPVRAGYWLGAQLIGELARTTTMRDLLDWDLTVATTRLRHLLDD